MIYVYVSPQYMIYVYHIYHLSFIYDIYDYFERITEYSNPQNNCIITYIDNIN